MSIILPVFENDKLENVTDYKSMFQEYVQVDPTKKIVYRVLEEEGPPHDRTYKVSVLVDEIGYGVGKGRTKKFLDYCESIAGISGKQTLDILDEVIAATNYLDMYDEHDEEDRARLENIKELRSVASMFPLLTEFLENVSLVEQESAPGLVETDAVTFMTLHAAKGLEFPIVFMIGMEEGIFPHSRSLMDKQEIEEERRLAYVGITRAKKKLFLTYARKRLFFGQRTTSIISRFLLDLPKTGVQRMNSMKYNTERYDDDIYPEYF